MPLQQTVTLFKALAHSSRLRLVAALSGGPRCVEELSEQLGLAPSTISHHLKTLAGAGLVTSNQVQYYTAYSLVDGVLDHDLGILVAAGTAGDQMEFELRATHAREQMLKECAPDGRIVRLPAAMRRREVLLEAFSADLEPGRDYTTDELDAVIRRRYPAPAVIRRQWLDWQLIAADDDGLLHLHGPRTDLRLPPAPAVTDPESAPFNIQAPARVAGVYWIRNRRTGRVFLGADHNVHAAFNRHRARLFAGRHFCEALQQDWLEMGPEAFDLEIVETLPLGRDQEVELARLRSSWLAGLQPLDEHCYDMDPVADGEEKRRASS